METQQDPIAIIGIGCRFPGNVDTPETYWQLLKSGSDGIVEVPSDRWNVDEFYDANPTTPGKMYVRSGGFLTQKINEFDALFFGMSPREAGFVDPQQRLLMEVAWEALEDAGIVPEQLAGTDTGVYVGGFMLDNLLTQFSPLNRDHIGSYSAVGSTLTILSNRLSYIFDLRGPSITMDTACSSSLVALHEACQSIWRGECTLALSGGVNIMHRPENLIAMCKGGFLSPDGRSKSFDIRANGYGRGEGAGIVILKPYSAAVRDGDDIYGLIRGTGANQDGRTDGITVPNPASQEALIRKVCAQVNVDPMDIRYVEAHGTGTPVGDPLEAGAIGSALGQGRTAENACVIGSVKANIGHLEAASGVAGLIKLALCLKHKSIPPLANLTTPNPNIPFTELGLRLPLELEPMPAGNGPAYVSINSFGYGGTNAHAILQEVVAHNPEEQEPTENAHAFHILPLSARGKTALVDLATAYRAQLENSPASALNDVCYSATHRRTHHDQRVALVARDQEHLLAQLDAFIAQGEGAGISAGTVSAKGQKPVFVFTGMGPQWWAMGQELFATEPVFRQVAEECDVIFKRIAGWSIVAEMLAAEDESRITETHIAQPANFVIQAGLAALWRSWGVEPAAVVGHSVGEVTSAYIAGVLSLEDALLVSYHRSRIQKKAAGIGGMLAVGLSAEDAAPYLAQYPGMVSLAAANAPTSITLAGDSDALNAIASQLQQKEIFNRMLTVEVAYHSPTMEPLKPEVLETLANLELSTATLPLYSTVTGDIAGEQAYNAPYWCDNIREPVYFEKAMSSLIRDGYRLFIEVGPHPVLSTAIKECFSKQGVQGTLLASLRRNKPERETLFEALASFYVSGGTMDWKAFYANGGSYVKLPAYPWQRENHWNEAQYAYDDRVNRSSHALLGRRTNGPSPVWESTLNNNLLPYLDDHRVEDLVILPGAAYVELGLAVQREITGDGHYSLENLEFHKALIIAEGKQPRVHTTFNPVTRHYAVYSREQDGSEWQPHANGYLSALPLGVADKLAIETIRERCTNRVSNEAHYVDMNTRGLHYGPYFQGARDLWLRPDGEEVLALIEGHDNLDRVDHKNLLHPSLLDACFQSLLAGLGAKNDPNVYVPVSIRHVRLYGTPTGKFWCYSRLLAHQSGTLEGNVTLCDIDGNILVEVQGVRAQALTDKARDDIRDIDQWLYKFAWQEAPVAGAPLSAGNWLIFSDQDPNGVGAQLTQLIGSSRNESVTTVHRGEKFTQTGTTAYSLSGNNRQDFDTLFERINLASFTGVIYLWGLDETYAENDIGIDHVVPAIHLVQALGQRQGYVQADLFFITRNAQVVSPAQRDVAVTQAPLIGFVRVATNEFDGMHFRLIDIDQNPATLPALASELFTQSLEEEVSLRADSRYVNRLVRQTVADLESGSGTAGVTQPRRVPAVGEAEVALESILTSTPINTGTRQPLDQSLAFAFGTVVATGSDLSDIAAGTRVLLPVQGQTGPFATTSASLLFNVHTIPENALVQLPSFVQAYYAVDYVAGLSKGEHILIHSATSAVGLSAIQLAQKVGAVIYATAGDADQRTYLSSLGINHVFDSGSTEFADQIQAIVGERGLDVVLNNLEGEAAAKTFELLGSFGRFLNETSSKNLDFSFPARLRANQTVVNIDIRQVMERQPAVFGQLVTQAISLLDKGIQPLNVQRIQVAPEADADTSAQQSHFGITRLDFASSDQVSTQPYATHYHSDASYLITGGFGGFGLEMASWLVTQGVRNLILVGRSGANTPEAKAAVEKLIAAGAHVLPVAADISREADVIQLLETTASSMPPLKGIFHAAAVLDDGVINTLDRPKLESVMRPKALGAWLLHRHTYELPLDYFVMFSSVGSLVGNPGQAAYVTANSFLDMLAHHRHAQNLAATCINWGALAEVGMAARQKGVEDYLNRLGFGSLTPRQAIQVMGKILETKPVAIGATIMDWPQIRISYPTWGVALRNSVVMAEQQAAARSQQSGPLDNFAQLPVAEHHGVVANIFMELVAKTLRIPQNEIDQSQSLLNIGMDSLMAIEIQAAVDRNIGVKVSTLQLMKGSSLNDLILKIVELIATALAARAPAETTTAQQAAATPLAVKTDLSDDLLFMNIENANLALDELSDAEVALLLKELLEKEAIA